MNNGDDITGLNALELSRAIHRRDYSCVEVMSAYLARIESVNPRFKAIVSLRDSDQLMAEAALCDQQLEGGHSRGWMHGFPLPVKDLADAAGLVTSMGSPILRDNVATTDSIHVARMRQAGALFTGKSNVPEFGLGSQSYNSLFGTTLNPWDPTRTAGGSSGGAAAALALAIAPVADGSDMMGSLRNPAAFCNVIGMRPTPGLVPYAEDFIEEIPCNGPMGRTVADTARLLATLAGHDPRSPTSLPVAPGRFLDTLERDVSGTRIGWLGDLDGYLPMESGVVASCEAALSALTTIGCEVASTRLAFSPQQLWETWLALRQWLVAGKLAPLYRDPGLRELMKPEARWEVEQGLGLSGQDIYRASEARGAFYRSLLDAFEQFDLLALPSAQVFPFDAELHWPREVAGRGMDSYHRWMEVVVPGTLAGCPVISMPAGFNQGGLPMGLQLMAPRYRDFELLQLAHAYEQATRWNLDHSPSPGAAA